MRKIKLTRGNFTLIDNEDFEQLNQWKWTYATAGYAYRQSFGKLILMHRLLLGLSQENSMEIDYINGNSLDNRKQNLRIVTRSQNSINRPKQQNNTSGYKGVWFDKKSKRKKRWVAEITLNQKKRNLGYFNTKEEAAMTYNQFAKKLFGEYAFLNIVQTWY